MRDGGALGEFRESFYWTTLKHGWYINDLSARVNIRDISPYIRFYQEISLEDRRCIADHQKRVLM